MAQAIRGVSNNIKKISLSNYSLTTQIIIINLLTTLSGFIFIFLLNYFLLINNKNLDSQIDNIKNDLNKITNYLSNKSVIRKAHYRVETCLRSKDHQIVLAIKCLEDNKKTFEKEILSESKTFDLQLDPYSSQEYVLDNYQNKTNSIKIYKDKETKYVDTESIYISSDVVEVNIAKDIEDTSNNQNLFAQYRDNYLYYFNNFQEYFNRNKIRKEINKYSNNSKITTFKDDTLKDLVEETITKNYI